MSQWVNQSDGDFTDVTPMWLWWVRLLTNDEYDENDEDDEDDENDGDGEDDEDDEMMMKMLKIILRYFWVRWGTSRYFGVLLLFSDCIV